MGPCFAAKKLNILIYMRHVIMVGRMKRLSFFLFFIVSIILVQYILHPHTLVIADEIAYFLTAESLATHGTFVVNSHIIHSTMFPFDLFVPARWGLIAKYPPGWPLFMVVFFLIPGSYLFLYLNIFIGTGTIVLCYLIGKEWFGEKTGFLAAVILALSPTHSLFMNTSMSDIFSTFLICLSVLVYLFALKHHTGRSWILNSLCGLIAGYAVCVRYSNIYILAVLISLTLFDRKNLKKMMGNLISLIIGLTVPLCFLLWFHHHEFGSFFQTGYSIKSDVPNFISDKYFKKLLGYLTAIITTGLPGFGLFGLLGLGLMVKQHIKKGIFCLSLGIIPILIYSAYYWYSYSYVDISRFIVSSLPFLAIGGAYFILTPLFWRRTPSRLVIGVLCGLCAVGSGFKLLDVSLNRFKPSTSLMKNLFQLPDKTIVVLSHSEYPASILLTRKQIRTVDVEMVCDPPAKTTHPVPQDLNEELTTSNPGQRKRKRHLGGLTAQKKSLGRGQWYDVDRAERKARNLLTRALNGPGVYAALNQVELSLFLNYFCPDCPPSYINEDKQHRWMIVHVTSEDSR